MSKATFAGGPARNARATLAGGCFWCTEAIFHRLRGVKKVIPGYSEDAESIQIEFNPKIISYKTLLEVFFATHDPTTLNRQGNDVGSQYRSAIFYHDDSQKKLAEKFVKKDNKIVTELTKYKSFSEADRSHREYYEKNRNNPYCKLVIDPKILKLTKKFKEKLKTGN